MIPSLVASQLQDGLVDYIQATLALDDDDFAQAFTTHLRGEEGLFRGPYVRLGLPFATADTEGGGPLTIGPPFKPYRHQRQAFEQLYAGPGATPANTLVTTGTGSGKTECFLYPILDHCYRNIGKPGVKAIVIYPMNALATDQARRLADLIYQDPRLRGSVTAGLYVGGPDAGLATQMGPHNVIESKSTQRNEPPDILLTNYKMLDFMLVRPDERKLWEYNQPRTLRYLVIDELHTFDGAQGSDVGCLIRRLKRRLQTPRGHLVCAGTSATIGSANNEDTFTRLAHFAQTVFDEPFAPEQVVREQRQPRDTFLRPPDAVPTLPGAADSALDPASYPSTDAWLTAQQRAWTGSAGTPTALGEALRSHPFLHHLLAVAASSPTRWDTIDRELGRRIIAWGPHSEARRKQMLTSFFGLISHARRMDGARELPLLTVQVQLWCRELNRLLRALPDQADGALQAPQFQWFSALPSQQEGGVLYAPQAHCRECGIVGLAAAMPEKYKQQGRLDFTPSEVGQQWLNASRDARFVWPRPLDAEQRPGEVLHWLDPRYGSLHGKMPRDEAGNPRGTLVLVDGAMKKGGSSKRFAARCPACGADDALSIVGARAASLLSVAVTQLFHGASTTDKKLLAFTDSVQDACHRAGFFGGRTYRIHLRTAMQAVVAAHAPLPLADAGQTFERYWRGRLGDFGYVAAFLPPDLRELAEFQAYTKKAGRGKHDKLWGILKDRIAWEFTREYGVAAGYGRSLERTATSTAEVAPERIEHASEAFARWVHEQPEAHKDARPGHFLRGLVYRMRQMGAIFHPFLDTYAMQEGRRYLLSGKQNPYMSPMGPFSKRIRFLASQDRGDVFPCPFEKQGETGWFADWAKRSLDWPSPGADEVSRIYGRALAALTEAGVLQARDTPKGGRVWGIAPQALRLTCALGAVQTGHRGRVYPLADDDAAALDGGPAWIYRSTGRFRRVTPEPGYYAALYNRGETTRVYPGEHTGLLTRRRRTELETRFLTGATASDPHAPNLLVATPTLEMGVDIGDLSATMLCSVPPTPANYLQRIGRAGRKTGNAMVFVLATNQPHDLYFHAEPERMLDGEVQPPGVFLEAVSMLRRQLSAWCMDHWARDDESAGPIPRKAAMVIHELGRAQFPGRMLSYVEEHQDALIAGFLANFGGPLSEERRDSLRAWLKPGAYGMAQAFHDAFDHQGELIKGYVAEGYKVTRRITAIEADPTAEANPDEVLRELKQYHWSLQHLIENLRNTYPLNVLADASLLPNYAFPETGVKLHSQLRANTRDEKDAEAATNDKSKTKKRNYDKREYMRPAARALTELAPFANFYAEGHKVQVRELDLGPKGARVQYWRFCRICHHRAPKVDPTETATEAACPVCGDAQWSDNKGQVLAMLPMNVVRSVADRVRSTTIDDTEERTRERFHIHQVFDVKSGQIEGQAVLLPKVGFGFEFLKRLPLTELNLGLKELESRGTKRMVAGETASAIGFPTCRDCGTVRDPRHSGGPYAPPEHSPFCPQKSGDTKPRLPLVLYREVESEAVRFLLPISEMYVEERVYSLQAALAFGLRRRFGGRPVHLSLSSMSEPDPKNAAVRKHYLVLFDTVPGGTGYLREYREPAAVFQLLADTLDGLLACGCRKRGQDGCYLCLFAHQVQRHLPIIRSSLAERVLTEILANQHDTEAVDGLSGTSNGSVAESELEERFIATLQIQFGDRWTSIDGGTAFSLRLPNVTWRVDHHVDLTDIAGKPMVADFVFECLTGPTQGERVVVECDGAAYHVMPEQAQGRVSNDLQKRSAVASRPGWRVFALVWHDLHVEATPAGPRFGTSLVPPILAEIDDKVWDGVCKRVSGSWDTAHHDTLRQLRTLTPFGLLCAYLQAPGPHWEDAIGGLLLGKLGGALRDKSVLDGASIEPLRQHIESGAPLAPLPVVGLGGARSQEAALAALDGDLALLVSCPLSALKKFDSKGVRAWVRLDDRQVRRQEKAFVESWRATLQVLNYLWNLENLEVLSDENLGLHDNDAPIDDFLAEIFATPALSAADDDGGYRARQDNVLRAALALCSGDADAEAMVRGVFDAGLPLPRAVDPEDTADLLPTLAWPDIKLAVLDPEQAYPDDIRALQTLGWRVLTMPVPLSTLLAAIRSPQR